MKQGMKKRAMAVLAAVGVAVMLSGCTLVTPLTTPEARDAAVREELDRIVEAIAEPGASERASEVEALQCEHPWIVWPPKDEFISADELRVDDVEPLDLAGSNYAEQDPDARFYRASISGVWMDVVVRVDAKDACLWAMNSPSALLLGL